MNIFLPEVWYFSKAKYNLLTEKISSIRNKYLEIVNGKEDNFKNYITLI